MITRISLKNWKSHLDSEFRFNNGVNAIVGIMGSGKTSIVQALTFALFGTFPALQSRKISIDDLIMKKPQRKKKAEISLDFQVDGKTYTVKRIIEVGKRTTHAEIRKDGKLVEVNPQGVNRVVQDVLQMDYELFSRAVYSEQDNIDYFLTIPKGQRMQHIDRMLKLDRFEKVREASVSLSNRISQGRTEKSKLLSELEKENLEDRIKDSSWELKELEKEEKLMETDLEVVKSDAEEMSKKVNDFDDMGERMNKMNIEIESVRSRAKEIEENLKSRMERMKGMEPDDVPKKLEKVQKEIETLEEEIEKEKQELEEGRNSIASLNAGIGNIKEQISDMERLGDKCPVCESDITESKRRKLTDVRKGKEMVLRNKVNSLADELEKSKKHIKLLEEQVKERVVSREKLDSLLEDMDYIKDMQGRRKGYIERENEIEKQLEAIKKGLGDTDIKNLREELQETIAKQREIIAKLSGLKEKIRDKEGFLKDMKEREDMLKRYREGMKKDEEIADRLDTFVKVLRMTQDQLREEFLKNVNHAMKIIWKVLYPYVDYSDIRLTIDKDYVLQLKGSEGWVSAEGTASGGERSIASLALRIAFSMALVPNLKWLILDEPTHNLDINAIEQFGDVLRERMSNFVEQVFLITHEERISEGVLGSLYRLERNKEVDEPTKIIAV